MSRADLLELPDMSCRQILERHNHLERFRNREQLLKRTVSGNPSSEFDHFEVAI